MPSISAHIHAPLIEGLVGGKFAGGLLDLLLDEQQSTAVDRFSQWHDVGTPPLQASYYRDLVPLSLPRADEQYAFEVDLDACSGCKACVAACHSLNGLEESETWRSVGLLHGGSEHLPVLQHVTTACHHCLEPACLDGCPVEAYEKDPLTGIVRHLDDQCIGCQYCILKCPYDVPKYSHKKGIVRKCDMCSSRLAVGEAPACVQACPNQAIRVTVVNRQEVAQNAEANLFLPGAPEPAYTLPTTVYRTNRPMPANLLPADYYSATVQHAHWPLVLMLVLTQMSVGAFLVDQLLGGHDVPRERLLASALDAAAGFVPGMIGLLASTLHLGRPWLAYRAIIGWRTSWLSREVIAFGAFAAAALLYALLPLLQAGGLEVSPVWQRVLGGGVAIAGVAGVASSTMIYASTRRPFWNPAYTVLKFLGTCAVLGIPAALLIRLAVSASIAGGWVGEGPREIAVLPCLALAAAAAIKLLAELAVFGWLRSLTLSPMRRTALLMSGALARVCWARFLLGILGGLVLPGLLAATLKSPGAAELHPSVIVAIVTVILTLNTAGELLERYLFFAAVIAPKMPGAPNA